jgi:transposase
VFLGKDVRLWSWGREKKPRRAGRLGVTSEEKAELAALRSENRRLREDNEILKRAMAFFASMS